MRIARSPARGIARVPIALTPRVPHARRRTALWLALCTVALVAVVFGPGPDALPWAPPPPMAAPDTAALAQALEKTRMQLRLSEARSRELENQIDALNQRVREGQEQLSFFRSAHVRKP